MENIQVRYTQLGPNYFHKYLVYTDSNGKQYAARGGPSTAPTASGNLGGLLSAQAGSATSDATGSPYGAIVTEHGEYKPTLVDANGNIIQRGFTDYDYEGNDPSETIATGDNLSATWNKIIEAMDAIEAEGHLYRPLTQNSNSAVDEALIRAE